jgi:acyl-CoA reductase-like NAD-dependent aldehyde dehydrogenase
MHQDFERNGGHVTDLFKPRPPVSIRPAARALTASEAEAVTRALSAAAARQTALSHYKVGTILLTLSDAIEDARTRPGEGNPRRYAIRRVG